jgi:hypothetical protein
MMDCGKWFGIFANLLLAGCATLFPLGSSRKINRRRCTLRLKKSSIGDVRDERCNGSIRRVISANRLFLSARLGFWVVQVRVRFTKSSATMWNMQQTKVHLKKHQRCIFLDNYYRQRCLV